jgi:hypothetical protein
MLRFTARAWVEHRRVSDAFRRAARRGLFRAAGAIRLQAARSIIQSASPSAPGSPPHTRKGQLRRAILFAVREERGFLAALIGTSFDILGPAGRAHEFGGRFRREVYPKRAFMKPALNIIANKLPQFFKPLT